MGIVRTAVGTVLGPYELLERLGVGGMAEVYAARRSGPRGFSKRVALKCILPQLAQDPRFVDMFCDEARIMAALNHANLVQVLDFGEIDGQLYTALEFVEGVSCARLLRAVAARGRVFPHGAALYIAHEVLQGLDYAHEACDERGRPLQIVHRDVSPGNILIGRTGEVKLTDFGILQSSFVEARTSPGELKGKLGYMSPEQVVGRPVDKRSDLFTLGIVLAEMLLARPLFPGRSELDVLTRIYECDLRVLNRHGSELPRDLLRVLDRALARDPNDRFQTARQFRGAVRMAMRQLGVAPNETELLPWLHEADVLPSKSGQRPVVDTSALKPASRSTLPSVAPPAALRITARPPAPTLPAALGRSTAPPPRRPRPKLRSVVATPQARVLQDTGDTAELTIAVPKLLGMAATSRVSVRSRVSLDGGPFVPLGRHPDLLRRTARRVHDWTRPTLSSASWTLPLDPFNLVGALLGLLSQQRTGMLEISSSRQTVGARRRKRLYFKNGRIVATASTEHGELFGERLVRTGVVSPLDVDAALVSSLRSGRRLGEELVSGGALRPAVILRAVLEQLEERVVGLGEWRSGMLAYFDGVLVQDPELSGPASPVALILRLVRESYTEGELAELLAPLLKHPLERRDVEGPVALLAGQGPEALVLELVDGAPSLQAAILQLQREGVAGQAEAMRALLIGLAAGVLYSPALEVHPPEQSS